MCSRALLAFFYFGLGRDKETLPSPLIGKPAPHFELPSVEDPARMVSTKDFEGRMYVLNIWGTWCVGCRQEHAVLLEIARRNAAPLIGLDWKDDLQLAQRWLRELGNPYAATAFDAEGRVAIDWGAYGAPETFLVDATGPCGSQARWTAEHRGVGAGFHAEDHRTRERQRVKTLLRTLVLLLCVHCAQAIDTAPAFEDPAMQARYERLTRELRCLQCRSETIADSNASLAADLRRQLRELIAAGKSDAEILTVHDRSLQRLCAVQAAGRATHLAAVGGAHPVAWGRRCRRRRRHRAQIAASRY